MSEKRRPDLEGLARPENRGAELPRPRRRWLLAALPFLLLLAILAVFAESARELFTPALKVRIVRPAAAEDAGSGAAVSVQAAGWVEPDPDRVRVTALAEGVVRKVLVQESDELQAGDPVCELIDEDAKLSVARREAEVLRARAELKAREAEEVNAKEAFEAAIEVQEALRLAQAGVRAATAEEQRAKAALEAVRAEIEVARNELATQRHLREAGASGPWQVELAEARLRSLLAREDERRAEREGAAAKRSEAEARRTRAEDERRLRLAEKLRLQLGRAACERAEGALALAQAELDEAKLRLDRMVVRTPVAGIVLSRDTHPGAVVGPSASHDPVCHLYDPKALRIRVDVPQDRVARVGLGDQAEIRCDARPNAPYRGSVLRIVEKADIQKVTLEVQLRVEDPDGALKPEMLCQVAIRGRAESSNSTESRSVPVSIPQHCLLPGDLVWVVAARESRAERRALRLGARQGDRVIVLEGLNRSDKIIVPIAGLEDGARIEVEER